jgi:hypothetical protein
MKKTVVLLLLSFMVFASYSKEKPGKDHPIVGRWEYVKTILPDGSEVIDLIATEHYYSDGTLLYVNVWLSPQAKKEFSNTIEEVKSNFKSGYGGIATYKVEKGEEKDKLTYTVATSSDKEQIGRSTAVDITLDKDTLIFYFNGNQVILKRVTEK